MAYIDCARCYRRLGLPDYVLNSVTVRCPFCDHTFEGEPRKGGQFVISSPARGAGRSPSSAADPCADGPHLTAPHPCHQCHGDLPAPTGRRRCTVCCPSCRLPTSVYAVLHYCLGCNALLESPSRCQGTEARCPACATPLTVPRDFLFHDPGQPEDETPFGFRCRHCRRELHAALRHAGETAVCPHCLRPSVVPPCGYAVAIRPARAPSGTTRPCGFCELEIPTRAPFCPHCGTDNGV